MKKRVVVLWLLISIFLLNSCSFYGNKKIIVDDSENRADKKIEQLIEVIKNEDKDELESMFSEKALNETEGFEDSIDYLFDYIQGNIEGWERFRFSGNTSVDNGKKSESLVSWYTVQTDQESYMFFIIDFTIDTINPDNEGLYTLRVIKAKDEDKEFGYVEDMKIPGIYIPKE
ncbi:protein of unknown function [Anaerocolumna jejuensis DSM 15929]|uniref:DUF5104 domain-containing protein n=1 Tax=Anaerocolumna jejuensis DSM 15929 TaxID=1121322 RepID=A0A1M6Y402_9FIRM|nr:DUF5104 domain-containing protein [Anaerocolumna jejuensis]SHL12878.1 protein of unknown function [Anaerocolumna jejuensis DSM 15929]